MNIERHCLPLLFSICQERLGLCCGLGHLCLVPKCTQRSWQRVTMRAGDTQLCSAAFQQQMASQGEVAFWSHVGFHVVHEFGACVPQMQRLRQRPPAHHVSLCYTLSPSLPSRLLLFLLGFSLRKETGLLDWALAVWNHFSVSVLLLQLFTLIEVLIKAQAILTAGAL